MLNCIESLSIYQTVVVFHCSFRSYSLKQHIAFFQIGQTPMSIAERLGYLSVVEILRPVTAVAVATPLATDEKYRVISPEIMQEAPMSDSEDEGGTS